MAERTDRVGQRFGDYWLRRRLGGGGFGEVYLGEHVQTKSLAAVKVLHIRLTRSEDLRAFINEVRTFRLQHPHIVRVLDVGITSDETPFLVMEYAPNGTLRDQHPKGTRLLLSTVLAYVAPLASALQYAHDLQLVHRDVKPENMLLGAGEVLWLSDFGIATVAHSTGSLTTEGMGGTLPYMAPEQIQGRPRPQSDQYALAIVVYEWLTGTWPFRGTPIEIAMQHQMTPPPPLRTQVPTLPLEVEQVVLTALSKDPKERFGSVQAFAMALEQASQTVPTHPGVMPAQVTDEKRSTPPSQPLLSTLVMVPPNQSAVPTEPVTSGPVTSPSQAGKPPAAAAPSSLAEPVLPKTPPSHEPASALEKEKASAPSQALLPTEPVAPPRSLIEPTVPVLPPSSSAEPTVPASFSPSAPIPLQFGQVPEHLMPGPAQSGRRKVPPRTKIAIVSLVFLIAVIVGASVAYTIISTSNSALNTAVAAARATATTAAQVGNPNPYGGTLVISDPMSGPGSAFGWETGGVAGSQCNFKNGAYHVFGICDSNASISTKFAFEIYLSARGNCGNVHLYSHSAGLPADVFVCQNGSYDLTTDVTATSGEVRGTTPAMRTGIDQPNIIGIVSDGTHITLFINHVRVDSVAGVYTDLFGFKLQGLALGSNGTWSANFAEVAYTDARLWSL